MAKPNKGAEGEVGVVGCIGSWGAGGSVVGSSDDAMYTDVSSASEGCWVALLWVYEAKERRLTQNDAIGTERDFLLFLWAIFAHKLI